MSRFLRLCNIECNLTTQLAPSSAGGLESTVETEIPVFEIFRGHYGEMDVVLLAIVDGLCAASDHMLQIAAEKPGPYFLFSCETHRVLLKVDTTNQSPADELAWRDTTATP
jgi:hypothetical protein